jgi:dethiobiotin synthetase
MSRSQLPPGFFVTGTDTGVGKTSIAVALLRALVEAGVRSAGMKPVASGCELRDGALVNEDALALIAAGNLPVAYEDVNPYAFAPAIAPHVAARQAGVIIDRARIRASYLRLAARADCVVVEGAGGWLVPVGPNATLADVALDLALPVILVVGMRLGCINHALLTAQAIAASGLTLAGWVANDPGPVMPERAASLAAIAERVAAPRLADVPSGAPGASVVAALRFALALS